MLHLRVGELLRKRGLNPHRVVLESGLPRSTVYGLANPPEGRVRVDLDVLTKVMQAVERISGEPVGLADVLVQAEGSVTIPVHLIKGEATYKPPVPGSPESLLALAGALDDPDSPGDVSERHDHYLGLALEAEQRRILANSR